MFYLIVVAPKTRFRNSHQMLVKVVESTTKESALKESGYVTQGRNQEYQAPEAHKIELGQEINF